VYTAAARRGHAPPLMSPKPYRGAQALFTFSPSNVSLAWGVMWRCMQSEPGYDTHALRVPPSLAVAMASAEVASHSAARVPLRRSCTPVRHCELRQKVHSLAVTSGVPVQASPPGGCSQTSNCCGLNWATPPMYTGTSPRTRIASTRRRHEPLGKPTSFSPSAFEHRCTACTYMAPGSAPSVYCLGYIQTRALVAHTGK